MASSLGGDCCRAPCRRLFADHDRRRMVLPLIKSGMIEASITRIPWRPCTLRSNRPHSSDLLRVPCDRCPPDERKYPHSPVARLPARRPTRPRSGRELFAGVANQSRLSVNLPHQLHSIEHRIEILSGGEIVEDEMWMLPGRAERSVRRPRLVGRRRSMCVENACCPMLTSS